MSTSEPVARTSKTSNPGGFVMLFWDKIVGALRETPSPRHDIKLYRADEVDAYLNARATPSETVVVSAPVDYQCRKCGSSDVIPWPTNSAPSVAGPVIAEPSSEGSEPAAVGAGPTPLKASEGQS